MNAPRYLTHFHPKRCPHYFADVLIIGSGLAGLRAANSIDPQLSVLVVTKDIIKESNSNYAQGGIAGVLAPEDSFADHTEDTLTAGGELCDRKIVELVVKHAPAAIKDLMHWGVQFDRENGELLLGREGGHSHRRIVHALGDATGKEVIRGVSEWTNRLSNVQIWEHAFTLDLLTNDEGCCGALVSRPESNVMVWAKQTILATGGAGQLYRETTNPQVATGDGHAMAYRAGAELRDMEFMQFHPTVLYIAGSSRSLITEAMRGEGAHLVDRNNYRFMQDYDARLELAPRDIVSQSAVTQMEKTRHGSVYLDLRHLDAAYVHKRFPGIAASCAKFGLDIARDRIPVRPGAHYMIGGLTVDDHGRSTLPNLWAAGEATSSGLHGANRLASNSLLEGLVFGDRVGEGASEAALKMPDVYRALNISNPVVKSPDEPLDVADICNSLKALLWRSAGVRRERETLLEASDTIEHWCRYVLTRQFDSKSGWELQNMLTLAPLLTSAALQREESRGTHLRTDFPAIDETNWQRHIAHQRVITVE